MTLKRRTSIFEGEPFSIAMNQRFSGYETAGIKFHAPVDTVIGHNHIYLSIQGIWLDWMNQGARVTQNLMHDNGPSEDLFVEVDHGPFMIDNLAGLTQP